jgi:Spy/CpxP family protein refolding chaperone
MEERAMRTKRWLWVVVPVLLGVSVLGLTRASASGPFCGWHGRHAPAATPAELEQHVSGKLEHLLDAVDASAAQRQQAAALVKASSPELFDLMREGRSLRGELKVALLAEKLDQARIAELREQLSDLSQRLIETGMDGVVKVSGILTPAQRAKVADKLAHLHMQ